MQTEEIEDEYVEREMKPINLDDPNRLVWFYASVLTDIERVRIANENRKRALTRSAIDKDGEQRGLVLDESDPGVVRITAIVDGLIAVEDQAIKDLTVAMKAHPLGPFVKRTKGLGEKQAGRLLGAIGDPYWHTVEDRPRTVSELWAYCGLAVNDGHAQARARGQQSNWSTDGKMRAYLCAVTCIKSDGPYRKVYDLARLQYEGAVHPFDCKRCGPSGKPALAGTPLSKGHQHARALRRMSKEILKDLWTASKEIHTA